MISLSRRYAGAMLASFGIISLLISGGIVVHIALQGSQQHDCHEKFFLLNARRRCESDEPPKKQEYDLLLASLTKKVEQWKGNGQATHITVYFRDLENGPIFGLNEQEHFAPASLLKVPIMIALLKKAESNPALLQEQVSLEGSIPPGQNVFDQTKTLILGQQYSIAEVLRRMIVYSDNSSKELLRSYVEANWPGTLEQIFIDLGISLQNPDGSNFLTVKSYASLFRSLYNASYLNREMSQQALELLAEVQFSYGIEGGVPEGIVTAHKFGYLETKDTENQLHDCGIIYAPQFPYLLCVMTRGDDTGEITSIMAEISHDIYAEVSTRNDDSVSASDGPSEGNL